MKNIAVILFISFIIISCGDTYRDNERNHAYTGTPINHYASLYKIKNGDAIYTRICGDFMKVIVLENDTNAKMITYKRPNYFERTRSEYRYTEVKSWDEIITDSK